MRRICPYCGLRFRGKELSPHIYDVHQGAGKGFFCRDECVRCCTDKGAPLELVIGDVERIAPNLGISFEEFFKTYADILWTNIPGTHSLIPAIGLPFPCKFLKEDKCSIYEIRPLHCRLFPERLYVNQSPQILEPFYKAGYQCMDQGFFLDEKRIEKVSELMDEDYNELLRTAEFFKNEEFIYELTPSQHADIQKTFESIDLKDPERNRMRREIIESMIPQDVKDAVGRVFLDRLRTLDDESKD